MAAIPKVWLTVQAELCELALRQVSKNSGRSADRLREACNGSNWPEAAAGKYIRKAVAKENSEYARERDGSG
jgi:hypothetical protein